MAAIRTATLDGIDPSDIEGTERRWNAWIDLLAAAGLRPAEEPESWTDTSMTYRVFRISDEKFPTTLDFDIAKIIGVGTAVAAFISAEAFSPARCLMIQSMLGFVQ